MFKIASALAATLALTTAAHGATLASGTFNDTDTVTDSSKSFTFSSAAAPGTLSFHLDGFTSLDGLNYYEDDFTLTINGVDVFKATWDLGGGGTTFIYTDTNGATYTGGSAGSFAGGAYDITVPFAVLAGSNTVTFTYDSLPQPVNAGFQGLGDEGWGIGKYAVTTPVPEPTNGALLLAGLGALGLVLRRRARKA